MLLSYEGGRNTTALHRGVQQLQCSLGGFEQVPLQAGRSAHVRWLSGFQERSLLQSPAWALIAAFPSILVKSWEGSALDRAAC